MPVIRRKPTKRQLLAWQQLREWELLEKQPCYCRRCCGLKSEAQCLLANAARGAELVARFDAGGYVWPPQPHVRIRYPRRARCSETQNLIGLVLEQCLQRKVPALWISHPEFAALAGCSVPTARRAQAEAVRQGWLEAPPAHLAGAELEHRAELRGGNLPTLRYSRQPVKHLRCGNMLRLGRVALDELRIAESGHTRRGLLKRYQRQAVARQRQESERATTQVSGTEQAASIRPAAHPDQKDQATEDPQPVVISSSGSGSREKTTTARPRVGESTCAPAARESAANRPTAAVKPTRGAETHAPTARADRPATSASPTERPTAAATKVKIPPGAPSAPGAKPVAVAPALRSDAEEKRRGASGDPSPAERLAQCWRSKQKSPPLDEGESFEDLHERLRARFRLPDE